MKRLVVIVMVLGAVAAPAVAAEDPQRVASEISAQIMSPYCDGVTLHDCPSRAAIELRDRIAGWAEQGWSRARIMDRLESEFGEGIHAAPSASGSGLVAWALPALALVAGLVLAFSLMRRFARRSALSTPTPALSTDDRARVDRELDRFRREL